MLISNCTPSAAATLRLGAAVDVGAGTLQGNMSHRVNMSAHLKGSGGANENTPWREHEALPRKTTRHRYIIRNQCCAVAKC